MDKIPPLILQIALDTPLRRTFDYRLGTDSPTPSAGARVRVPFGRRELVGLIVGVGRESSVTHDRLKPIIEVLDAAPIFDRITWELVRWAADYYHHPLGEVIAAALPAALRGGASSDAAPHRWRLTEAGRREFDSPTARRAPRQRALLEWLAHRGSAAADELHPPFLPGHLQSLKARGWVAAEKQRLAPQALEVHRSDVTLTAEQTTVLHTIDGSLGRFTAHLLYGVTGSGKTEVYLQAIAAAIASGGQALVLVPEIALTPQLVERFRTRFSAGVEVMHSGLTASERREAWRRAHAGHARIVIGTRSAVFTSLPSLRLIVVDEEHDASYKQHEGFRYSARDLAVWRAQRGGIPIVLGSATPSLETLENAAQGRYSKLLLPQRPGIARAPHLALVDLRKHAVEQGLSQPALHAMSRHLGSGGQIIVFLNRRGYAPSLFCTACGWVAQCAHCDARLTLHRRAGQLRCHHCGAVVPVPAACGSCGEPLHPVGQGTERVEETLQRMFPDAALARLDRDTAGARGGAEAVLDRIRTGEARILVGTQMLTKGHHFPDVSLVVILDADQGLFASDFRATERLAQTITQVAGRAGRALRPGEVVIQTAFPDHPLLKRLIAEGYEGFAVGALEERRRAEWPPYSRLAMLRGEAKDVSALDAFLREAASAGRALAEAAIRILGPATALIARRADHYRAHILIQAAARPALQRFLATWIPLVDGLRGPPGLRWSIDVDPIEVD